MDPVCSFIGKLEASIINPLITLIAVLAFLYFVWGVVVFIRNSENEEKRAEGQRHIIYGLIGLVILFGANTLIHLIATVVGGNVGSC